jgi:hypothetical protein
MRFSLKVRRHTTAHPCRSPVSARLAVGREFYGPVVSRRAGPSGASLGSLPNFKMRGLG